MQKFFLCKHCKNLIGMIDNKGVPLVCCGEKMEELVPNTVDAATEKHMPIVTKYDTGNIKVDVGSVAHPMTQEHNIEFVYVQTEKGGQRKGFDPDETPSACFSFVEDKPVAVFSYCNLHGLWKTEI